MEKRTNAPITPIRLLPGDSSSLFVINTAVTRGGEEIHSRGGGGTGPQGPIPLQKKIQKKKKSRKPQLGSKGVGSGEGKLGDLERTLSKIYPLRTLSLEGQNSNFAPTLSRSP